MIKNLSTLTNQELGREIAHARNRRDAFPTNDAAERHTGVMTELRSLLGEQERRREARRAESAPVVHPDYFRNAVIRDATERGLEGRS